MVPSPLLLQGDLPVLIELGCRMCTHSCNLPTPLQAHYMSRHLSRLFKMPLSADSALMAALSIHIYLQNASKMLTIAANNSPVSRRPFAEAAHWTKISVLCTLTEFQYMTCSSIERYASGGLDIPGAAAADLVGPCSTCSGPSCSGPASQNVITGCLKGHVSVPKHL